MTSRLHVMLVSSAVLVAVALTGCGGGEPRAVLTIPEGGDPMRGRAAIQQYGCSSCHTVPGVRGADGQVGPPLTDFGRRLYIAGAVENNPDNLMQWIINPDSIEPGTL
ncbi:MAG: cytochrome c, partial [Dehalococcoidia bacterium]